MFDFGSIMGSGSTVAAGAARRQRVHPRMGAGASRRWRRWACTCGRGSRSDYWEEAKSVGRFEGDFFDPIKWRPEYPESRVRQHAAGRRVLGRPAGGAVSDDAIRAIVAKGRYSEPGAAEHIAATLIKRRDKVLRAWLTGVNPIAEPGCRLRRCAGVRKRRCRGPGVSRPPRLRDDVVAVRQHNGFARRGPGVEMRVTETQASAPKQVLDGAEFVSVAIQTVHAEYPQWRLPVVFTFRRAPAGWQAIGIERTVPS